MPLLLLTIFIAVPLIEIGLFIQVGQAIGLWSTLAVVILTAVIGTWLLRQQGFKTLQKFQTEVAQGAIPTITLSDGICLLVAGLLLLTPGFFTDAIGFLLFVPAFRQLMRRYFASRIKTAGSGFSYHHYSEPPQHPGNPTIIDGEYEELDPKNK